MPLLPALPTSYRDFPVIPYAPNAPVDREHSWDWASTVSTIPSGLTIAKTFATVGRESWPLHYTGLSRAEARTLEQFFENRAGRKHGFWCPTFQQDFFASNYLGGGALGGIDIREWGYADEIWPLGDWAKHITAHRAGAVGGSWQLAAWVPFPYTATEPDGTLLRGYGVNGLAPQAGNSNVIALAPPLTLTIMRLLWVRFADDAIETRWVHPHFAEITLTVVAVPAESP